LFHDRDIADYTSSIRTNRWYLRVFFWALDQVVRVIFVVVLFCARSGIGPDYWKLYATKHGRYEFQIDLGMSIINYAIEQDWPDFNKPQPNWMRQTAEDLATLQLLQMFLLLESFDKWHCTQNSKENSHPPSQQDANQSCGLHQCTGQPRQRL
jgi:hypothetical protein